jgi:hypothetical protein
LCHPSSYVKAQHFTSSRVQLYLFVFSADRLRADFQWAGVPTAFLMVFRVFHDAATISFWLKKALA